MKYSKQREIIRQIMAGTALHPTADMVYEWVRRETPNISLATVYRNLNCLAQSGELRKIHVAGGADRFDGQTHRHSHLVCRSCGAVSDLDQEVVGSIAEDIRVATGFSPAADDMVFYGICQKCREEHKEKR